MPRFYGLTRGKSILLAGGLSTKLPRVAAVAVRVKPQGCSMNGSQFVSLLKAHLLGVLTGQEKIRELQSFIDRAVTDDALPDDLAAHQLSIIHDLQTELELIAEHQDTYAGNREYLTGQDISKKLSVFADRLMSRSD